jgi:hypothetical protein
LARCSLVAASDRAHAAPRQIKSLSQFAQFASIGGTQMPGCGNDMV